MGMYKRKIKRRCRWTKTQFERAQSQRVCVSSYHEFNLISFALNILLVNQVWSLSCKGPVCVILLRNQCSFLCGGHHVIWSNRIETSSTCSILQNQPTDQSAVKSVIWRTGFENKTSICVCVVPLTSCTLNLLETFIPRFIFNPSFLYSSPISIAHYWIKHATLWQIYFPKKCLLWKIYTYKQKQTHTHAHTDVYGCRLISEA